MFQAGALGQKRHQMTFDGVFHRREHLVVPPAGQQFYKLFHHNGVSSAMPGHGTVRYIQVHFFAVAEEVVPHQVGEIHISLHTAVGTHHLDGTVAPFGERGHGKIDGGAAVQLDIYHLVVHNVVVAVINTAAVGAGAQRLLDVLGCGVRVQHVMGQCTRPARTLVRPLSR